MLAGAELSEDAAAALRGQMEELLRQADEARGLASTTHEEAEYGRQMWAHCEALTAGSCLQTLMTPSAMPSKTIYPACVSGLYCLWSSMFESKGQQGAHYANVCAGGQVIL